MILLSPCHIIKSRFHCTKVLAMCSTKMMPTAEGLAIKFTIFSVVTHWEGQFLTLIVLCPLSRGANKYFQERTLQSPLPCPGMVLFRGWMTEVLSGKFELSVGLGF